MAADFFEAIRRGDQTAVDDAIADDAALLAARDPAGLSPVMAAAYGGHSRLAERLATRVAATRDGLGLFEAAVVGDVAVVRRKLSEGAEVEDRTDDGYTPLHLAAYFGRLEVARFLLERGADPNAVARNESRVTPLHSAVARRHRDVAGVLLAFGASANVVQHGGWTPLHSAAHNGDEAMVDLLLLRGADPTRPADDGRTPIDVATEGGYGALAGLLREATRD
jgi:ankyrin repeat protein